MDNEFVQVVYFDADNRDVVTLPPQSQKDALDTVQSVFRKGLSPFAQLLDLKGRVLRNMAPNAEAIPDAEAKPFYQL